MTKARSRRGAIVLFCALALCSCERPKPTVESSPTPVRLATVERYSPEQGQRYSASILPNRQVNLAFKVNGLVESLHQVRGADGRTRSVDMGDLVTAGTVLAQVRTQDYRLQVSQVQGQVQQAGQTEQAATAQLAQAQAAAVKAEQDFTRADALYRKTSLTRSDYDAAKANRDSTLAQVNAGKAQQQASAGALHASQAMLGSANLTLGDTSLAAPFTGVVVQRSIELGSLAGPSTVAFVLADISSVKASFGVSDITLAGLKKGSKLAAYAEAFPNKQFTGFISAMGTVADSNTRSFQIDLTILNRQSFLRPGMIVSLDVGGKPGTEPLIVAPLSAIVRGDSGSGPFAVVTIVSGVARRRPVALGTTYGDRIAVTGVEAGQKIVSSGTTFVSDGDAVTVIP